MTPYYQDDAVTLYCGDCRELLPTLEPVSLVVADPPYHGVVGEAWDNVWATDSDFLRWADRVVDSIEPRVTDNGTLYWFCSSRMSGRIEQSVARSMSVIANCVWCKGDERGGVAGSGIDVTALRTYWSSTTERCVVAEKMVNAVYNSADDDAKAKSGYWSACEGGKRGVFGDYLATEFARAGVTRKQIAALFPSKTGGMTGCVSNWLLGYNIPTLAQYEAMRQRLNAGGGEYLRKDYEDLRKDYEDLRKDYEDLRKDYEDLRRPFFATSNHQWGEVWRFGVTRSERLHPTQKPEALIGQIVSISSRHGDTVLDPFAGSGTTLVAAKRLGRKAIGIEINEAYCEIAARRLSQGALPLEFAG